MEVLLYHTETHQVTLVTTIHANMYGYDDIYHIWSCCNVVTINRLSQRNQFTNR